MLSVVFSLDYEIYGNGAGAFEDLMLGPTEKLLSEFNARGARLTIMAEVAEILALKRQPAFHDTLGKIEDQLRRAVADGHDVQLHTHPAWFKADFDGGWRLNWPEYCIAALPEPRIHECLAMSKAYLEDLLTPVDPGYRCIAYRAGNWLIQPSRAVVASLEDLGFTIDTSVFKGGYGDVGGYPMDYRNAHDEAIPWTVDTNDINLSAERDGLTEIPILCREVFITSMLTPRRLYLQYKLRRDAKAVESPEELGQGKSATRPRLIFPKKFDFCRLSAAEMRRFTAFARAKAQRAGLDHMPVVAIGHSTEYLHDGELGKYLDYINEAPDLESTTFRALDTAARRDRHSEAIS